MSRVRVSLPAPFLCGEDRSGSPRRFAGGSARAGSGRLTPPARHANIIARIGRRHSQEAKATVCKTVIPGSSPGAASTDRRRPGRFFCSARASLRAVDGTGGRSHGCRLRHRCPGAGMAKLVDARDLKSLGALLRAGSSPAPGTSADRTRRRIGAAARRRRAGELACAWPSFPSVVTSTPNAGSAGSPSAGHECHLLTVQPGPVPGVTVHDIRRGRGPKPLRYAVLAARGPAPAAAACGPIC